MKSFAALLAATLMMAVTPALADQPPKPTTSTDPDHCTWVWQTGGGLGAWTEQCKFDTGLWQLKYADDPAGFSLFVDDENTGVVLAPYAKPAEGGIETVLPELRKLGLIPDDNECAFQPADADVVASIGPTPKTRAFFEIMPTGKRKEVFDATPEDEIPEPPCGEVGYDPDGMRLFMTDVTHPTGVAYMNLGQDGTMFEPRSVTWESTLGMNGCECSITEDLEESLKKLAETSPSTTPSVDLTATVLRHIKIGSDIGVAIDLLADDKFDVIDEKANIVVIAGRATRSDYDYTALKTAEYSRHLFTYFRYVIFLRIDGRLITEVAARADYVGL